MYLATLVGRTPPNFFSHDQTALEMYGQHPPPSDALAGPSDP